jgi:hypothetical protein
VDFDMVQGKYGDQPVQMANFGGDNGCNATFYRGKIPLEGEALDRAKMAGAPLFTEDDFIRIQFPGNNSTVYDQPVTHMSAPLRPSDTERFPRQWAAYRAGQAMAGGTPLADLSMLAAGDVRKFEGLNIFTLENLADVSDANLPNLGLGGREAREAARLHIMQARAAKADPSDEIAALRAQLAELTAKQDAPRRGRPPLEKEAA